MRKSKDYLLLALKGMGMGAADVVPGVSGGTIAFIVGIYEELIDSIKSINLKTIKLFFTLRWVAFFLKREAWYTHGRILHPHHNQVHCTHKFLSWKQLRNQYYLRQFRTL